MLPSRLSLPLPADDSSLRSEYRLAAMALHLSERKADQYVAWIERMETTGYTADRALAEWGDALGRAWDEVAHLRQRITDIALLSEGRITGATVSVDYSLLARG